MMNILAKRWCIIYFTCASFIPISATANITISPKRVILENGQKVAEIMLINRSDKQEKFRIILNNQKMLEDGSLADTDVETGNDYFAKDKIIISPRQVRLEPKATQKIRIMTRINNNLPDGEYRTHLLVQNIPGPAPAIKRDENDKGLGVSIRAIFGMSIPIIIRKGSVSADISISDPKFMSKEDGKYVQFKLNRTGNKSVIGTAEVFSGNERIGIIKNLAIYLSEKTRTVLIKISPEKVNLIDKNNFLVTYEPDKDETGTVEKAEMRFNLSNG